MTSIFDHLRQHIDRDPPAGISPFDLTDLPEDQKRIMLALLRSQGESPEGVPREVLLSKMDGSLENFDALLHTLSQDSWIVTMGEPPNLRYRIRFRARRSQTTGYTLWSILFDRAPKA